MSYELSISRGYRYGDSVFSEIALDEWSRFIEDAPDFVPISEATGKNPKTGEVIKISLMTHRETQD